MRDFEVIDPTSVNKVVKNLAVSLEDSDDDEDQAPTLAQSSTEDKLLS